MATFRQLPGRLNLALVRGDEFPFDAEFNLDLTGYTVEATIYNAETEETIVEPALTVTPGTESTVAFLLTEADTEELTAGARMRWYMRWTTPESVTRTVLAGTVEVSNP